MNDVLFVFLSLSLSGSLLALALFALKPMIRHRFSKAWQYYIFLIVIARLLLPFGPDTGLMANVFQPVRNYFMAENAPVSLSDFSTDLPVSLTDDQPMQPGKSTSPLSPSQQNAGQAASQWLWLLWLVPAAVLLLRKTVAYFCYVRAVKARCAKVEDVHTLKVYRQACGAMNVQRPPALVVSNAIAAPMLVGAIRPVIALPNTTTNGNDLQYILQHELIHHKRWDAAYKWLVQITVCLHWFNPLIHWVKNEINRNCELSCDEAVIKHLSRSGQCAYGDMLLNAINLDKTQPHPAVTITLSEDSKRIKERLSAIMNFKKPSPIVGLLSALFAGLLLCGATFSGVHTAKKPNLPISEGAASASSIVINTKALAPDGKISLGAQHLRAGTTSRVSLSWKGNNNLTLLCTSAGGDTKPYTIESGKEFAFQIDANDEYTIAVKNDTAGKIRNIKGSITFEANEPAQHTDGPTAKSEQTVVYENVELRRYAGEGGHPYIHDRKTNHTTKQIIGCQHGMLAFDEKGNPLRIDWWSLDTEWNGDYYYLHSGDSARIPPKETLNLHGGWSLDFYGLDPAVDKIAYVLYCDKEITFEDGTVWKNPDFEDWRNTYEGKVTDVAVLENYYPYEQKIAF